MKVAVCGHLPTACETLRGVGVSEIDVYNDALELTGNLHKGVEYQLILVYTPFGEGIMDTSYPYRPHLNGEWKSVPIRLLDEPACSSALIELAALVKNIKKDMDII